MVIIQSRRYIPKYPSSEIKRINHKRNRHRHLHTISWVFDFSDVGSGRVETGNEGEGRETGEGRANELWRVSAGEGGEMLDADDEPDEGVGE